DRALDARRRDHREARDQLVRTAVRAAFDARCAACERHACARVAAMEPGAVLENACLERPPHELAHLLDELGWWVCARFVLRVDLVHAHEPHKCLLYTRRMRPAEIDTSAIARNAESIKVSL